MLDVEKIAETYNRALPMTAPTGYGGSLLMLSGLPASGKSAIARGLAEMMPAVRVSTDAARRIALETPTYEDDEVKAIYRVCHQVIGQRLRQGQRVVFDASNHRLSYRNGVYELVDSLAVPLALCVVAASPDDALRRLRRRADAKGRIDDLSDALLNTHEWMAQREEPIRRPYLQLDSSEQSLSAMTGTAAKYWRSVEGWGGP